MKNENKKEEKNKIYISENKNISFIRKELCKECFLLNYNNKNYKDKNNLRKYGEKE